MFGEKNLGTKLSRYTIYCLSHVYNKLSAKICDFISKESIKNNFFLGWYMHRGMGCFVIANRLGQGIKIHIVFDNDY